jgi:hypothetical protein
MRRSVSAHAGKAQEGPYAFEQLTYSYSPLFSGSHPD